MAEFAIDIGKMFHRGVFQSVTNTNTKGVVSQSWGTHATRWMGVETEGGREYERARQVRPEMTHLVTCRYLSTVTAEMRISVNSQTLDILGIENVGMRDRVMRIYCRETT